MALMELKNKKTFKVNLTTKQRRVYFSFPPADQIQLTGKLTFWFFHNILNHFP
jgi:ABC-type uncharacterized transport system substrate-binding protein